MDVFCIYIMNIAKSRQLWHCASYFLNILWSGFRNQSKVWTFHQTGFTRWSFVTRGALAHRPIELPGQGGWGGCDRISALSHRGRNCALLISCFWEASWNSDTDCVEEKQTGRKSERFMYTLQRYKSGIVVRTVKFGNSGFTGVVRCNRWRCPGLHFVVPPHPQLLIKEFGRVQLRCRWGKQMSSACCEWHLLKEHSLSPLIFCQKQIWKEFRHLVHGCSWQIQSEFCEKYRDPEIHPKLPRWCACDAMGSSFGERCCKGDRANYLILGLVGFIRSSNMVKYGRWSSRLPNIWQELIKLRSPKSSLMTLIPKFFWKKISESWMLL